MFADPIRRSVAQEDYLRAISKLSEEAEPVTVSALAGSLGVTSPSVTGMIQKLVSEGLVQHEPRSGVRLTRTGRKTALSIHRRHRLVETFLVEVLGLDWDEVHEEAEALEHHLSDRLVRAIDRYLGHPQVDPHGHPIPAPDGTVIERHLLPLESLAEGEDATIREMGSDEPERIRRWKELGLVPGARVRIVSKNAMDGVWQLDVVGRPVTTGLQGLAGLRVERTE
jgi:DtxR family transcriptional regulator, Mn-dependent transcriptional regulator